MTSSISANTTFRHQIFSELRAIIKFYSCVIIILGQLCIVSVWYCSLCRSVVSDITNKTTIIRFAHWKVRSEILIKSTLSVRLLSTIRELGVGSYLCVIKICFISIAERIWVNIVFCIIKESVSCV